MLSADPTLLTLFLSQYENDRRVPAAATRTFLSEPLLLAMGIRLRDRVLANWSSGSAPLTLQGFYDMAYAITADAGTALLLCHNVAKAFGRGGSNIRWENVDRAAGTYTDGTTTYTAAVRHSSGVLNRGGRPSIFYLLFLSTELGMDDPGDWYHYFVTATPACYSASGRLTTPSSTSFGSEAWGVVSVVDGARASLAGSSPSAALQGWAYANALSFLEGGFYGSTQTEVARESRIHLRGAAFGVRQGGASVGSSWQWQVPLAGSISRASVLMGVDIPACTSETLNSAGVPLTSAGTGGGGGGSR